MAPELGYGSHKDGSRKGKVHQLFDKEGPEAVRSWFAAWKRVQSKSKGEIKTNSATPPAVERDGLLVPGEAAQP
jgi:hypothetical protein